MPRIEDDAPRRTGAPAAPSPRPSSSTLNRPARPTPPDTATADIGEAPWKTLLALHPDGLVVCVDATIRLANPAAAALLGAETPEQLVGRSLFHFTPQHTHQLLQQHRFLAECGEVPPPLNVTIEHTDGPSHTVQLRSTPAPLDGQYAVQTILRDVTEERAREEALRTEKQHAERANRLKSRFLAQMSHEIRTPLTSIIGFAEILDENDLGKWNEYATYIERSSHRLLHTINSVLDLSRLEAGSLTFDPEPIDIGGAVREAAELFTHRATQNGIRLQVEVPPTPMPATMDPKALGRVLDNLIGNAIKFTDEGGRIVVRAATGDGTLTLSVQDTGVGIAPQFLPHLFEPFKQGHAEARDAQPGSGLGLAITHQLVELMGGTIAVDSEENVGTRFTVTLPI